MCTYLDSLEGNFSEVDNSTSHPSLDSTQPKPLRNSIKPVEDCTRYNNISHRSNRLEECLLFTEHDPVLPKAVSREFSASRTLRDLQTIQNEQTGQWNERKEWKLEPPDEPTLMETYITIPPAFSETDNELFNLPSQNDTGPTEVGLWYNLVKLVWLFIALYAGISPSADSIWLLTLMSIFVVGLFHVPVGPSFKFEDVLYALYSVIWLCVIGFFSGGLLRWLLLELWNIDSNLAAYLNS